MLRTHKLTILIACLFFFITLICTFLWIFSLKKEQAVNVPKAAVTTQGKEVNLPPKYATISGTIRVPILIYHYVEIVTDTKDTYRESLNIHPVVFEQQLKTLREAHYDFLTARQLGQIIDGKLPLPAKPIILTFDDGHWDMVTDVLPLLKKYQISATAYIIPGKLNGSDFLTTKQLHELQDSGLFDIGAHTVNHVALKGRPEALVRYEVMESKNMLEKELGVSVVSFAYPNGSFDEQAIRESKAAGFTTAVSTLNGTLQSDNNRFTLYRIRPGNRIGKILLSYLDDANLRSH